MANARRLHRLNVFERKVEVRNTTLYLAVALTLSPGLLATEEGPAKGEAKLERGFEFVLQAPRGDLPVGRHLMLYRMEPEAIEGFYELGETRLEFSGRRFGEQAAEVRIWSSDGSFELKSHILTRYEGWIRSGGVQLSGRGEIDDEARMLVAELARPPISEQLVLLPLEIGCRLSHRDVAPLLAAFLQPWQVVFKHTGMLVAQPATLRLSAGCSYVTPRPGRLVILAEDDGVARVHSFSTLDAAGAAPRGVTSASTAPCNAKCRGACGADCSSCSVKSSGCEFVCPTHWFCQHHDACYDSCGPCWSPLRWLCKLECDRDCLEFGFSELTCAAWSQGMGPIEGWININECSAPPGGGGGGGSDECGVYAEVQVVREPGITVAEIQRRLLIAEVRNDQAERLGAGLPSSGASNAATRGAVTGRPHDAGRGWRQRGPDAVFAAQCTDDDGDCADCSCQGEFTSWEGEVCGSAEEMVDECWDSCY